jgi:hypothetical protein
VEFPIPHGPRAVTEDEVRARFTAARGWRIRALRGAAFESRVAPVPATAACVERIDPDAPTDEPGLAHATGRAEDSGRAAGLAR